MQQIKLERQIQICNILNQRVNYPPSLNKDDSNKTWCYETINIFVFDKVDEFMKRPKKSYDIGNSNFNQLHFPINHQILTFNQFKLAESFKDKDEFKRLKIRFHEVIEKINKGGLVVGEDC